jgi:lipopolysaccharide heptosyltransferase II
LTVADIISTLQGKPQRIVVIDWSMIGDLIMLSPCIKAIHTAYPEAHLAILGTPASIQTYRAHPAVGELIPYDRSHGDWHVPSFLDAVRRLRAGHFDLAYIFHNSIGSALMAKLGGVKQRIGYRFESRDALLTGKVRLPEERMHLLELKANLLRASGVEVPEPLVEELHIDEQRAGAWLKEKLGPNFGRTRPIVAVSIGSTVEHKRWSASSLNEFLNAFPVNSVDFIFLGSPAERPLYEGVYSYNNTVVDLVGQTTIEELVWVLDRVDLFVGPDSGPVHMAVARKRPVVALFGPSDPRRCGPLNYDRAEVLASDLICKACEAKLGKQMHACLHTIPAAEIYAAATRLLKQYALRWQG